MIISKPFPLAVALLLSLQLLSQTYIKDVTVADVEARRLLTHQTVVFESGLITKIQSAKVKIPEKAHIIDGKGKYLIPGLVDAHIHFFQSGGLYTRPDAIDLQSVRSYEKEVSENDQGFEDKLRRYLQQGITTVVDVGSNIPYLKRREEVRGQGYAPQIFMTGPLLTTYVPKIYRGLGDTSPFSLVSTPDEGRAMVRRQLPFKPDFIKIWYILGADGLPIKESAVKNQPLVRAIIEEAHRHGLRVAVHAPERIAAQLAVESGCDFLVHSVEDELLNDELIQLIKKRNVVLCPTLIVSDGYARSLGQNLNFTNRELLTADPFQLGSLFDLRHIPDTSTVNKYKRRINDPQRVSEQSQANEICRKNLKRLVDAGVMVATGTDAGNIGTLHASSYLPEVLAMREAGLSNWQILVASTINGARMLGMEKDFGSVKAGRRADMLLLNSNPLDNIENLADIAVVINRGVVINPASLISDTPAQLAQRQLNAYNLRNIEAFLEPYADDVEVYAFPDRLLMKGKQQMRTEYSDMFSGTADLHCELVNRIIQGNVVIDREKVRMNGKYFEAVALYQIENHKISRVYFIE